MDPHLQSDALYLEAEQAVNRKLKFYSHLMMFVIVNCGMFMLNLLTTPQHLWAQWPMLGWGIGIIAHALSVFLQDKTAGLRREMIEKELEKRRQ